MGSLVLIILVLFTTFLSPHVMSHPSKNSAAPSRSPSPSGSPSPSESPSSAGSLNPIDACWRKNPKWATDRKALAHCSVGFGKATLGGKEGEIYTVTTPDDDPISPKPGTLRYGVNQTKPLWITFAKDMKIVLKEELLMTSHKTLDGRGAKVAIGSGPCILIRDQSHVIIHGISFHDCKLPKGSDGDAIRSMSSKNIWIDHCHFSRCQDGLIDIVVGSTAVTISNNYFTQHQKVLLLGNHDSVVKDKDMKVTIAFNFFGPGLTERMPRVRHGYAHVANNRYDKWRLYAIGGSASPTVFSEGNYFVASDDRATKNVTRRQGSDTKGWKWSSSKDVFFNGAVFGQTGESVKPAYTKDEAFPVAPGAQVPSLTSCAGPLRCAVGSTCSSAGHAN